MEGYSWTGTICTLLTVLWWRADSEQIPVQRKICNWSGYLPNGSINSRIILQWLPAFIISIWPWMEACHWNHVWDLTGYSMKDTHLILAPGYIVRLNHGSCILFYPPCLMAPAVKQTGILALPVQDIWRQVITTWYRMIFGSGWKSITSTCSIFRSNQRSRNIQSSTRAMNFLSTASIATALSIVAQGRTMEWNSHLKDFLAAITFSFWPHLSSIPFIRVMIRWSEARRSMGTMQ